MNTEIDEIVIKGTTYVPKDSLQQKADDLDGMEYKIFRTYSSGVFVGYLAKKEDSIGHFKCVVKRAVRIHYWSGAASLSQLAEDGVKPGNEADCRFAKELSNDLELPNVIEIIGVTAKAKSSIDGVPRWTV